MRFLFILLIALMVGCTATDPTTGKRKIDPIATGEIIGYTYLLTKDELKESDRKTIELAYAVFTEVVNEHSDIVQPNDSVKAILYAVIDAKFDDPSKEKQKAAVKAVVALYWSRVDSKFNVESMVSAEQMAVLKQVHIGIERALGR
jgi:hypothetical protein